MLTSSGTEDLIFTHLFKAPRWDGRQRSEKEVKQQFYHKRTELSRRAALAAAQGWKCTWCWEPLTQEDIITGKTHIDHVIPLRRGGPDVAWNRELLHGWCNREKMTQMPERAWILAREYDVYVEPPSLEEAEASLKRNEAALVAAQRRLDWVKKEIAWSGAE